MEHSETVINEANRLYWQTEISVADIAEQLSVSRRALYELVKPEPAATTCSVCDGDVAYVNRSAKTSGTGRCMSCGAECTVTAAAEPPAVEESVPPYAAGWPRAREVPDSAEPDLRTRALKIGSVAIAGAALGAVTALMLARRR